MTRCLKIIANLGQRAPSAPNCQVTFAMLQIGAIFYAESSKFVGGSDGKMVEVQQQPLPGQS